MRSRRNYLIVGAVTLTLLAFLTGWVWFAVELKSHSVLHALMEGDGPYSLDGPFDDCFIRRVVPGLVQLHKTSRQRYTKQMYETGFIDGGFNERVRSWHGIVDAYELTQDERALTYINEHMSSDDVWEEESRVALEMLDDQQP